MNRFFKIITAFCMVFICCFTIGSVSAVTQDNQSYINKVLLRNQSALSGNGDVILVGDELSISIARSFHLASIAMNYSGDMYSGNLSGSINSVNVNQTDGYVGVYSGFLSHLNTGSPDSSIYVDITAIFNSTEIVAIVSVGVLTDNSFPEIAMYGEFSASLSQISSCYINEHLNTSLNDTEFENIEVSEVEDESQIAYAANSSGVDLSLQHRGPYYKNKNGYNLFCLNLFYPRNLINGQEMEVHARVNTTVNSFIGYLREVEGYDNEVKGIALNAEPYYIDISIGGCHQDYILQQNECLPQTGQNMIKMPIIWLNLQGDGITISTLSLPIDRVSLSATKYVNADQTIPWNQTANWTIHNSLWDEDSLEGDVYSRSEATALAVLKYSGNITQSVSRTLSVKCAVRYQVNLQVNVGPVPVVITTGEYSLSPTITVYPASSS